jgi:SAM-dependent methyltransferase
MKKPDPDSELARDWDEKAADWDTQVGESGDDNRRLNSDPVLWRMLGAVEGLCVLDAGCGTGYLARALARAGAKVSAVDVSPGMISIAIDKSLAQNLRIEHRVDSVSRLETVADASMDRVVLNYVLMDLPDLDGAARSIARVLRPGGAAVAVFSHPCFPQGDWTEVNLDTEEVTYRWRWPYFSTQRRSDPPWRHFKEPFTWWHRPLSVYTRAFRAAGLAIDEMDEPHVDVERAHLASSPRGRFNALNRPYSIAFRLVK